MSARSFVPPATDGVSSVHDQEPANLTFLTVEQVAALLHCSVDNVRRIPRDELPYAKPGRRCIYRAEDVDAFVRGRRIATARQARGSATARALLDSLADSVRRRPPEQGKTL